MVNWIVLFFLCISSCLGLSVDNRPTTVIRASDSSELDRPEGIAFTRSGDFIAVANSHANTITFYKRVGEQCTVYETKPSFSISGSESHLNYPHDLSFSPDGNHLAVANRGGNTITIYKKNPSQNRYDSTPIAVIYGRSSQLSAPDSVRYSPVDNIIVVANLLSNTLTFYHYHGDRYLEQPYQVLHHPILKSPDGLDFSKDGRLLAVTSHDSHSVAIFQRLNGSQGRYINKPLQILQGQQTGFCYPHSLCFYPSATCLAVSCSQGRKNVHLFTSAGSLLANAPQISMEVTEMYDASTIGLIEKLLQEGGVKGVAFAPDGKSLAIVQNLCQDTLRLSFPVGVVAIYPVKIE